MTTTNQNAASKFLLPALAACLLFLFFRNAGLYPLIFVDEWIYGSAARFLPLDAAQVPSYLYFGLYRATNFCGDSYFECNKVLNELFFVGAAPLIYALARRVAPSWAAVLIAVAATLAPANSLTPFFMPEAPYYFAFWLTCWTGMWTWDKPGLGRAAALGALLGASAMVKLHAIFLIPAVLIFTCYAAYTAQEGGSRLWLKQAAVLCAVQLAAFAIVRFGLGYALAGKSGLHLLGKLYAEQAQYTASARRPLLQLLQLSLGNLRGQLMMLAMLYGVPIAVLLIELIGAIRKGIRRDPVQSLAVLSLLMLGSVLGVTVIFTASITGLGEQETVARIHTRYYNFALPLLLICAAAALRKPEEGSRTTRTVLALPLLALLVYAWADLLKLFAPTITDSPELRAASLHPALLAGVCMFSAAALLTWIARPAQGARFFMTAFVPVMTLILAVTTTQQIRKSISADAYSAAGLFVKHNISREQSDKMSIVAPEIGGLHRTRFFIENPNVTFVTTPANTLVDWDKVNPDGLVLIIGKYQVPDGTTIVAQTDSFSLARIPVPKQSFGKRLDFSQPLPAYIVKQVGLSVPEPWGRWSDGGTVKFTFEDKLPAKIRVTLKARAFGPNAGQAMLMKVGDREEKFELAGGPTVVLLDFDTAGANQLEISIPAPTAPATLGPSVDQRKLGIGFESLKIEDCSEACSPLAKN